MITNDFLNDNIMYTWYVWCLYLHRRKLLREVHIDLESNNKPQQFLWGQECG